MIERLFIVIISCLAIIFMPYWIGKLLMGKTNDGFEGYVGSWWLGCMVLMMLLGIFCLANTTLIPWIINGTM